MNVSALNSTPVKSQPSFGKEYQIEDAEHIMELSGQLEDSFSKAEKPAIKSAGGILASVIGAVLAAFVMGKCAASKVTTAFPSISTKITNGLRKGANSLRNYADDVANGVKLQKGGKLAQAAGKKVAVVEKFARNKYQQLAEKMGAEGIITNAVGLASVATIVPEILKVDGNQDGISDIAQRNVSAYKNAMKNVGIVSEIVDSLS